MNDTPANPAAVFDAADPAAARAGFNPHLVFYHSNGRGNGAAIQFSVEPATADRDGAVFFSIARQNATAGSSPEQRFASFDWANKTTVKLSFMEVAEILMVFGGQAPALSHAGKDGLYHNSPSATTSIELKRSEDPARPGFLLGVGRTPKADPNARQYHAFVFRPAEAVGLRFALQSQMGLLAFGELWKSPSWPACESTDACPPKTIRISATSTKLSFTVVLFAQSNEANLWSGAEPAVPFCFAIEKKTAPSRSAVAGSMLNWIAAPLPRPVGW